MAATLPYGISVTELTEAHLHDLERVTTELGRCAEADPEAFFPEKGGSTRYAKTVCEGCEARRECLMLALLRDERFGVWGGLTERARRPLTRLVKASLASTALHPESEAA